MPLDPVYPNQYAKSAHGPNDTVIVEDSERGMDGLLADFQRSRTLSSYQRLRQSISYKVHNNGNKNNRWSNSVGFSSSFMPTQFPISPPLEAQSEANHASIAGTSINQQWFPNADMAIGTKMPDSYQILSQDMPMYNQPQPVKVEPQTESRSPSIHSNGVSVSIDSYSTMGSNDRQFSAENSVKEEQLHIVEWDESSSAERSLKSSPEFPKVSGFMVSEDTSDIPQISLEQERRSLSASLAVSRHTPSALQPASVARRRKHRNNSIINIEQIQQPRPLQIVQEDGLGGAISSEDFVSPPRGARRKGPLTIVGRANAGLRRKNKDTCVQCRLNKRKV